MTLPRLGQPHPASGCKVLSSSVSNQTYRTVTLVLGIWCPRLASMDTALTCCTDTQASKHAQDVQTLCSQGSATPRPLLWPLGLCPEAPWVPSTPVRGAKGRLQCAHVQILIGQHLTTSQGPSSSRKDRGAVWMTGSEIDVCESHEPAGPPWPCLACILPAPWKPCFPSLGTWDPRSMWAAGDFLAWLWEQIYSSSVSPWEVFSL